MAEEKAQPAGLVALRPAQYPQTHLSLTSANRNISRLRCTQPVLRYSISMPLGLCKTVSRGVADGWARPESEKPEGGPQFSLRASESESARQGNGPGRTFDS